MTNKTLCVFLLTSMTLIATTAHAGVIGVSKIETTGVQGASVYELNDANNLIDGSGLNGSVNTREDFEIRTHAGFPAGGVSWATEDSGVDDYFSAPLGDVQFLFTLDRLYFGIDTIASWGYYYGPPQGNSMSRATLEFSHDGGNTFHSSREVELQLTTSTASVVDFIPTYGNAIRMTVTDNFASAAEGGDRVGLSEIRFANSPVPEPSSALVVLIATGMLAVRRRR